MVKSVITEIEKRYPGVSIEASGDHVSCRVPVEGTAKIRTCSFSVREGWPFSENVENAIFMIETVRSTNRT